jgi:hypothetical protein
MMVVKQGLIFKAGNYPDKGLSMTPAEVKAMAMNFTPVPNDLNHKTTLRRLDSKLGRVTEVTADDRGHLFAKVEMPEWLNDQIGKDEATGEAVPIGVSCVIDKVTKRLKKLAFTDDPRVEEAAVFAAFSKANPEEAAEIAGFTLDDNDEDVVTIEGGQLAEFAPRKTDKTYDGQSVHQSLHDMAARAGGVCNPTAEFHSSQELKGIQQIHDTAVKYGAKCRILKDGETPSYFNNARENEMSIENENIQKPNESSAMVEFAKTLFGFVRPNASAEVIPPIVESNKEAEFSEEAKRKIAELEDSLAAANQVAEAAKVASAAAFEAGIKAQAAQFADELGIKVPVEREICIAAFSQAIRDDASSQVEVTFSKDAEGKEIKGGRVETLKAAYGSRKSVDLTQEQLDEQATAVLLSNEGGDAGKVIDIAKVKERAAKLAEELNRKGKK